MKYSKYQYGMSLVELMVAMVISLFLLAGIVQVYLANKTSYTFSDSISRIQENGRFSLDNMTQDLRMAGFFGCATFDPADTSNLVNNLDPLGPGYNAALYDIIGQGAIEGTDNGGLNGSDSVTIRGAAPGAVGIQPPYNTSTSAMIHVTTNAFIQPGNIVMVSNCRGADIFQVTNKTTSTNASKQAI
ncbi:MAG: PilW family protein, partial [Gammaproteobacteria bacterium]